MTRIALLGPGDAPELFAAFMRSAELHHPWVTPPASAAALAEALGRPADVALSYGIRDDEGNLAGVINVTGIIRGPFQNAFLGYYALSPYEHRGHMSAGLRLVLDRAFGEHGLHRVEANIQPGNARSIRLVTDAGFRFEGHSPRYLRIGGQWRDHDHYALTAEEWSSTRP